MTGTCKKIFLFLFVGEEPSSRAGRAVFFAFTMKRRPKRAGIKVMNRIVDGKKKKREVAM